MLRAFQTSIWIALVTAAVCTVIGVMAAIALTRYEFRGKQWMNTLVIMPALVPETILGVGLLLLMKWAHQPRSYLLLLLGHIMLALPFVVLVVQARLIGIKRVYEEAALSLGANRFKTFREVTLPLLMPAIVASVLLVFTISFDNITASLFWRPPGVETMPTQILAMLKISISPEINALGTLMIVITVGLPLAGWPHSARMPVSTNATTDNQGETTMKLTQTKRLERLTRALPAMAASTAALSSASPRPPPPRPAS